MGIQDIFKINEYKQRISELETEMETLKASITPEIKTAISITEHINQLKKEQETINIEIQSKQCEVQRLNSEIEQELKALKQISTVNELNNLISQKKQDLTALDVTLKAKNNELIQTDEKLLLQSFGLYEPKYELSNSEEYKRRLENIRQHQKDLVKNNLATTGNMNWTVDGNLRLGQKMVNDTRKLLLRAFNSECDHLIEKVKYSNYESAKKRITSSYNIISKLGSVMGISITQSYYNLKIDELTLAFEYQMKKQEEKEQQRELRAQMREEAKLLKEIEVQRKTIKKEQTHYENALNTILARLDTASENERESLIEKKQEIEGHLSEIAEAIKDIDYREANQKAGYVYVISNIGSFGDNVYKIGMTRRLDPTERVDELGDASVPFKFDIHAMIFSEDAPALEAALHRAFAHKKVNMVNTRREFFHVTLDEIKAVVKDNFDKTVEFIDLAEAEQYRISEKIRRQLN